MTLALVRPQGVGARFVRAAHVPGLLAGLLLLLAGPAQAGPIFVAGKLDGDKFVPAGGATPWYSVRYSTATVAVEEDRARVQVDEVLDVPGEGVQAVGLIPLPEGADGSDVRVALGPVGARATVLADAVFLPAAKAREVYEAVARGAGTARLLAFDGRPALLVPRVMLQGKLQMTVTFRAPVRRSQGVHYLTCPMPAASWGRGPVERLALTVDLRTQEPLRTVFSPTHHATVLRKGLSEATVSVRADHWSGLDDFRLFWVADKDDLGLRALAYRGEGKEDGFFMLLGNPTGAEAGKVADKDVVFVLDTSGSMRGEKIEQARSALEYCLDHLNRGDRFNVITFGTEVRGFRDEPVACSPAVLAGAREFVESVVANGKTNIAGALTKALAGKVEAGRPRIMIFLTDGAPTEGELIPEKIVEQVQKANTTGTKIFVMGVGHDVNAHLLDRLAEVTDGSSEYVAPREELDAKIAALYDRLSHPVLSGVNVSFGDLATHSVLPPKLPVLFKGSEIMMVGRYKEGGRHTFTLSGSLSGKAVKYTCEVELPRGPGDAGNEFLAPLWAARQIGYLLKQIRLHGEDKELIEEVVRLSRQYGIVTEYTAFLAQGASNRSHDAVYREALGRIAAARSEKAGQWAVNQAANDNALQSRAVATGEANYYRDRRGNLTALQSVRQVGRRAFYLLDGQWSDAEDAGTRKKRVVQLFSPEYFALLRGDPTFARAQQLGWALSINVGSERIVVEKDGKQKDETPKSPSQPENDPPTQRQPNFEQQQIQNAARLSNQFNQVRGRNFVPGASLPGIHDPFTPPVTAAKIRGAIDDAAFYLRGLQHKDGWISDGGAQLDGSTALAALTLLAAGADPAADDGLRKALDWLARQKPNNTYVRALRANVWEYALRKLPGDAQFHAMLKEDYEWLLAALGNREGWRYTRESTDWDNSCTQYGVLGVWAAARAGLDPGEKFWATLSHHFSSCQHPDGGWGYIPQSPNSTPNMATAGLASLFLVFDMHHGKTAYSKANPRTFSTGEAAEVLKAIEHGMDWLGKAQADKEDGYYLYGIERTGVASGRKLIGGEDWFARGALAVLQAQQRNGSIPLGRWGGSVVSTCFCTLFLVYGGAPVAVNKLQFGSDQDWNLNPRDLSNLSKALWSAYERPVNWQTVSLEAPVADIEAPLLFLSGSKRPDFTEKDMLKLREYVERGGTILAEGSDHSADFTAGMEQLLKDMYPPQAYPGVRLEELPADHPVYTVINHDWKRRPRLRGAGNGSRTFLLVSDEYLSGDWQANREDGNAFQLAMNLLFYATDLGELEGKFTSILPTTLPAKAREGGLTVARVRHQGTDESPQDWEAAVRCWEKLGPLVRHVTGRQFQEARPVVLGKDSLDGVRLLHLTGRVGFALTEAERAALKEYVQAGGTVLADAHAGSLAFARAARKELEALFGPLQPLSRDPILAEGRFEGGVDLSGGVGFSLPARQLLRARGEKPEGQKLLATLVKGRPAVIFSEFDLVASGAGIANYHALAYKPDSARKILGNLVTYLSLD